MDDSDTPLPNLLCGENGSCFNEQYHCKDESFELESDSDHIRMLIQRETQFRGNNSICSVKSTERTWFECARFDAIKWILDTRALFGFHFSTAYLAMIYFDRFFSHKRVDDGKSWAIRLVSVASLSLAAKMEECDVPGLSEYHIEEYNFEGSVVKRMELLVLTTLEWRMNCATPFAYLNYFTLILFGEMRRAQVEARTFELVLSAMEEINVAEHRPSIVAAAVVMAVFDDRLSKKSLDVKMNAIPSWGCQEKEQTFSCYNLLQEMVTSKTKTPNSVISSNLLPAYSSSIDAVDDSTMSSAIGAKRRLTYIDGDQVCRHKAAKP